MKKKQSIISDKEAVLKYLLSQERDEDNTITLGAQRYNAISNMTSERFVQTLVVLEDLGYVKLEFAGPRSCTSLCYATMKTPGLTYFENQETEKQEKKSQRRHNWSVALWGAIITAVASILIGCLRAYITK